MLFGVPYDAPKSQLDSCLFIQGGETKVLPSSES